MLGGWTDGWGLKYQRREMNCLRVGSRRYMCLWMETEIPVKMALELYSWMDK